MIEKCFSIASSNPWEFPDMQRYPDLAPSRQLLTLYKYSKGFATDRYVTMYRKETLSNLNPEKVLRDIGEDAILVCWEGSDKFCHRHIVAQWLNYHTGVKVKELQIWRDLK